MIKKIDSSNSIVISDFDNGVRITYSPTLTSKKVGMIKLNKAVLKFVIGAVSKQNHDVFFENKKTGIDEIIDVFNASNKEVCIDITDELQNCFSSTEQEIVLRITNLRSTDISDGQVHFEYYFKKQMLKDQAIYPIDAGRAGSGEINLATGVLKFSFEDVKTNSKVLPISVRHTFSTLDAGSENNLLPFFDDFKTLPNLNCGKGWKTNFHQFIVKETNKEGMFSDEETTARYTYINADGDHVIFEDKYYYKNSEGKKCYIPSNVVHINQDNELSYLGHAVIKETKSDSGLTLITKFENMDGVSLLLQDNDDICALKEEIKSIEKSRDEMQDQINFNDKAIELIELSKEISKINSDIKNLSLSNEEKDIKLQEELKTKNKEYKDLYNTYSKFVDDRIYKYAGTKDDDTNKITYPKKEEKTAKEAYESKSDEIETCRNEVTYGTDKTTGVLATRSSILVMQQDLLNKNSTYSSKQYDLEIDKLNKQNKSYKNSIKDYNTLLKQKNHQLDSLLAQSPEILITNDNNNILGFVPTKDENVYKLFVIMDNYENQIQIVYVDDKIKQVIDSDGNTLLFSYQNDLLDTIEDSRQRKTSFKYDSKNNLIEVKHPSDVTCKYDYDETGNLILIKNDNGASYRLLYSNGKVVKVEQITYSTKITNNSIKYFENNNCEIKDSVVISYYDYESTQVTNTLSNKTTTYVFDTLGRINNKYDNVFENDKIVGNVNAVSFERINNKSSFAIKALAYSENYLSNILSDNTKAHSISENYFGSDAFCGEDVLTIDVQNVKVENEPYSCNSSKPKVVKNLTQELISKIKNNNITDLILSGWAKADSAWVKRHNTDYCGSCEESKSENSLEQLLIDAMDECKEKRRFELRAKLKYTNAIKGTKEVEQYCSFDWMNTQWQYCAFPVTLSEDPNDELIGLEVCFDYSNNTGTAQFYGMSLKCGEWEYTEFKEGMKSYTENSNSDFITTYEYDDKKHLIKSILQSKLDGKELITTYDYNQNGQLVRSVDYRNIVIENVYNDKGSKIKSMTYNLAEPANKFYTEEEIDEKGQKTTEINEFGERVSDNIFINKTGIIESTIDKVGNKVSYGYDVYDDTLLHITTTVNDVINSNIMQYNGDLLTSLTHNNTEINFEYNGFGQQTKSVIAGNLYSSTEYQDVYEKQRQQDGSERDILVGQKALTTFAKNDVDACAEQFTTSTDLEGNAVKVEFTDKNGKKSILLENRFDSYGNLIYTKDNELCSETGLYYDEFGRVIEKSFEQDGVSVSLKNDYDKYGNVKVSAIDIGGIKSTTSNNYDYSMPESKLKSISLDGITESYTYDKLDRVNETKLGNLYSKHFNYLQKGDHTSNLIASEWFGINGIIKDNLKYNYDQNGNITKVFENGIEIARYTYDAISRLIREDNKKLEKTTTFEYDGGGNIVKKTIYTYTTKDTELLVDGKVIPYIYPITGWRDQVIGYGDEKFEYDVLGNPTTYRNNDLKWSRARQLDKFNDIVFSYNAGGIRTSKIVNNVETTFYLDGTKLLAQDNGNFLLFHYGSEGVVGFTYQGVGEYYYKKNILGDVIAIIDKNGVEIAKYAYDAWGSHKIYVLNDSQYVDISTHLSYTQDGLNNKSIAEINPFRYRGYYYDTETKLYYLNSRYYDPETGRFINADDLSNLDEATINGLNLYIYCGNNPLTFTDPYGTTKWWEWLIAAFIVVALVIAAVAVTFVTGGMAAAILTGAAIGAGISLGTQAFSGELNWAQFALDIGVGAITGAIGGSGISRIGSIIVGTIIGGTSNIGSQLISGKSFSEINWWAVGTSAIIGGISGAISGPGAKNKAAISKAVSKNPSVLKAQSSVAKVGDKMAKGLYATARGMKSAYTQTMNRLSNAIFSAATTYGRQALTTALGLYAGTTIGFNIFSGLMGW